MKRLSFLLISMFLGSFFCSAQEVIQPAAPDKAVVYFVRPSALGFAINFSYFDSTTLVGRFNGVGYIRYECTPGPHLFWARSENKDFVEAELEAGKIYFLEAVPKMGAIKAGVELVPVDPKNEKKMSRIIKLLNKKNGESFTKARLEQEQEELSDVISRGMNKHKEEKEKGKAVTTLGKEMYFQVK